MMQAFLRLNKIASYLPLNASNQDCLSPDLTLVSIRTWLSYWPF